MSRERPHASARDPRPADGIETPPDLEALRRRLEQTDDDPERLRLVREIVLATIREIKVRLAESEGESPDSDD